MEARTRATAVSQTQRCPERPVRSSGPVDNVGPVTVRSRAIPCGTGCGTTAGPLASIRDARSTPTPPSSCCDNPECLQTLSEVLGGHHRPPSTQPWDPMGPVVLHAQLWGEVVTRLGTWQQPASLCCGAPSWAGVTSAF